MNHSAAESRPKKTADHKERKGRKKDVGATGWSPSFARGENLAQAKVILFFLAVSLLICFHPAEAQQPAKIPRIGYLSSTGNSTNPGPNVEAFRQGLQDVKRKAQGVRR